MIKDRYLNEANRIRETYIRTLELIKNSENIINDYKNDIDVLMNKNEEYINKNSDMQIDKIKENLKEELMDIELKITKIVNKINPYLEKIEKLRNDSKILYRNIKEEYPELAELEIQKIILDFIKI